VPLFALRFVPALCGSLIIPVAYYLMLELGFKQATATLAAFLLLTGNTFTNMEFGEATCWNIFKIILYYLYS
jgi:dolichyl-phosphate-mannose--protein O-mannosyl transferase